MTQKCIKHHTNTVIVQALKKKKKKVLIIVLTLVLSVTLVKLHSIFLLKMTDVKIVPRMLCSDDAAKPIPRFYAALSIITFVM